MSEWRVGCMKDVFFAKMRGRGHVVFLVESRCIVHRGSELFCGFAKNVVHGLLGSCVISTRYESN